MGTALMLDELKASLRGVDPCDNCGACLSYCQWDLYERQQPGHQGDPSMCRSCMVCFRICPRPQPSYAQNERAIFGAIRNSDLLGYYQEALAAKAASPVAGVQDGGVTTALLKFMLREGMVEAAILIGRDQFWGPQPFIASTEAEIERSAGSNYFTGSGLSVLGPALERYRRIAFVGLPCQVVALRNFQQRLEAPYHAEREIICIGLFCSQTFTHGVTSNNGIAHFVLDEWGIALNQVTRFDIKNNNLLVFQGKRVRSKPLGEIRHLFWPICLSCPDFAAELSDLSIGSSGSRAGENTVLVRSVRGQEVIEQAWVAAILERGSAPDLVQVEHRAQDKRNRMKSLSTEALQFLTKRTIRGNYKKAVMQTSPGLKCKPENMFGLIPL